MVGRRLRSVCQAARLIWVIVSSALTGLLCLLRALIRLTLRRPAEHAEGVEFFDGSVTHVRSHEGSHAFNYPVRMALVDLDSPPVWWVKEPVERLAADEVRAAAGTSGRVRLLTTPSCAGYDQNPIQIYYCEDEGGHCSKAVCEVTNTPWNHRVHFVFDVFGGFLPKPLHVSPLMDLDQQWFVRATPPSDSGKLAVDVDVLPPLSASRAGGVSTGGENEVATVEPLLRARLRLQRSCQPTSRAERADSFHLLWRYGLQPHRIAVRIYVNAIRLLAKGIAFRPHPPGEYKEWVLSRMRRPGCCQNVKEPWWRDNDKFPFATPCVAACGKK